MDQTVYKGTIVFINHDRNYVTISYLQNGKEKTINSRIEVSKTSKKHLFRIGDELNFQVKPAEKGDRMIAYNLRFLYNTALERLISQAAVENRFVGYLKLVDDSLYVKERDSYIFFPLKLSPWENPPAASAFNEAISFKLINPDKSHALAAELFSHDFIPEYRQALEHYRLKTAIDAVVARVSPFAIHADLFGGKLQARLPLPDKSLEALNPGDRFKVEITYLSSDRLVVKPV